MRPLLWLGLLGLGCSGSGGDTAADDTAGSGDTDVNFERSETACGLAPYSRTAWRVSDDDGFLSVEVDVADSAAAFQVAALPLDSATEVVVTAIIDPDGARAWTADERWFDDVPAVLASGVIPAWHERAHLRWPTREQDGTLSPGTWQVELQALDADFWMPRGDRKVRVDLSFAEDEDWSQGCLPVVVVPAYTPDERVEKGINAALDEAVKRMAKVGIEVQLTVAEPEDGAGLELMAGDERYRSWSQQWPGTVVIALTDELTEFEKGDRYVLSGGVPGPAIPSLHSGVQISWYEVAEADGTVDSEDELCLAEAITQGIGNYLGLPRPVVQGGTADDWRLLYTDDLEGTPDCSSPEECGTLLGSNVMTPSIDKCSGTFTDDQIGVMQRSLLVQ